MWTSDPEEQEKIWHARKVALWACSELNPDAQVLVTDMCVPISKFPDAIAATQGDILESGLTAPIVGHVGDGSFTGPPNIPDPSHHPIGCCLWPQPLAFYFAPFSQL